MSTDQVSLFLALLALLAQAAAVVLLGTLAWHWLTTRHHPTNQPGQDPPPILDTAPAPPPAAVLLDAVAPLAPGLAALVATIALAGSLYFSEIADFPPCRLCWYQRICMYPLAVILTIAALRNDRQVRWYALPLAAIGAAISTYHIVIERFPSLESGACDLANPCSIIWVERFGYLTIPTMALSGFVLIAVLIALPDTPRRQELT